MFCLTILVRIVWFTSKNYAIRERIPTPWETTVGVYTVQHVISNYEIVLFQEWPKFFKYILWFSFFSPHHTLYCKRRICDFSLFFFIFQTLFSNKYRKQNIMCNIKLNHRKKTLLNVLMIADLYFVYTCNENLAKHFSLAFQNTSRHPIWEPPVDTHHDIVQYLKTIYVIVTYMRILTIIVSIHFFFFYSTLII